MKGIEWFEELKNDGDACPNGHPDTLRLLNDSSLYCVDSDHYVTWQDHSDLIDHLAGFDLNIIEENLIKEAQEKVQEGGHRTWGPSLHQGHQTWVGLNPRQLQTTYQELYNICGSLGRFKSIVDLGAGYGRLGLVANSFNAGCNFKGYEYVAQRVKHGNDIFKKLQLSNLSLEQADISTLSADSLMDYDVFFIYDFGQRSEMDKVLRTLNQVWGQRQIKLVARGRGIRSIISNWHPWLNSDETIHTDTYSIYFP